MEEQNTKTYAQTRRDFYKNFKQVILPTVRKYEGERKKKLALAIIISLACSIIGITGLIIASTNETLNNTILIYIFAAFCIAAILIPQKMKKKFECSIKEKIMPTICSCFGNMTWDNGYYNKGYIFVESGIIQNYTSQFYDDCFKGIYNEISIEIIEANFKRKSGKNTYTIFNGVILRLKLPKQFNGHTLIKPNGLIKISPIFELKHTELEDTEFNKKFDVFTNNELEARFLITPTFMERLKKMKTSFNANNISCAFYHDDLLIAMPTHIDLFSICSLITPMDDRKQYFKMYEEMASIIHLIDYLKINQNTGL